MTFLPKLAHRLALLRGTIAATILLGGCQKVLPLTGPGGPASVAAVTVSPATATVGVGKSLQLAATPRDASGAPLTGWPITWASTSAAVATVDGSGLVTGVVAGSTTVTATCAGKTGTAALTVTSVPVASVTVSPTTASVPVGQTVQLTATPKDASGTPLSGRVITWASNNTAVATVNGGLVPGVAVGVATITATSEGQSGTATVTVTSPPPPPPPGGGAWPNENILSTYPNQTVLTDWGFDQVPPVTGNSSIDIPGANGWVSDYNYGPGYPQGWVELQSDPTAVFSPPNVYAFIYPAGYTSGHAPATVYFTNLANATELYVGFWWKVSNPWTDAAATNKITFLFPSVSGHQIFLYLAPTTHQIWLGNEWGGANNAPNVNASVVSLGIWHRVEWHVNIVAAGTSIAQWWLDGVLQGSYNNMPWSGATWSMFQFSPTWGGQTSYPVPQTQYFWFDHVHMSKP